jgi:hypothetical protein
METSLKPIIGGQLKGRTAAWSPIVDRGSSLCLVLSRQLFPARTEGFRRRTMIVGWVAGAERVEMRASA